MLNAVNPAVIALTHHRAYGRDLHLVLCALPDGILHQGVGCQTHVQGIGQGNGSLQGSQLLHLYQAAGLAESIVHVSRSYKLAVKYISRSRYNNRDAGPVVPISHCLMAYQHARHVCNLIFRPGFHDARHNAKIPDSLSLHLLSSSHILWPYVDYIIMRSTLL